MPLFQASLGSPWEALRSQLVTVPCQFQAGKIQKVFRNLSRLAGSCRLLSVPRQVLFLVTRQMHEPGTERRSNYNIRYLAVLVFPGIGFWEAYGN